MRVVGDGGGGKVVRGGGARGVHLRLLVPALLSPLLPLQLALQRRLARRLGGGRGSSGWGEAQELQHRQPLMQLARAQQLTGPGLVGDEPQLAALRLLQHMLVMMGRHRVLLAAHSPMLQVPAPARRLQQSAHPQQRRQQGRGVGTHREAGGPQEAVGVETPQRQLLQRMKSHRR